MGALQTLICFLISSSPHTPTLHQMGEKETVLFRKLDISVAEAEKRTVKNAVNMQETYTVYLIETRYIVTLSTGLLSAQTHSLKKKSTVLGKVVRKCFMYVTHPHISINLSLFHIHICAWDRPWNLNVIHVYIMTMKYTTYQASTPYNVVMLDLYFVVL